MSQRFCAREPEIIALVAIGQWPRQAGEELVSHVAECAACRDAVTVALALHDAIDEDIVVPDSAAVWQRAQWQAKQEALRVASRPVVAAQGVAALGLLTLIGGAVAWLTSAVPRLSEVIRVDASQFDAWLAAGGAMWSSFIQAARDLPFGLTWLLPGAIVAVLLVVGVAFFVSTLVDLASDPPAR